MKLVNCDLKMKRASSENLNISAYDKEFIDIENIINRKIKQMEQSQNDGHFNRRNGCIDGRNENKMSKRQQRSLKELNAVQSLEVWEEILDENMLTADNIDSFDGRKFEITLRKSKFSPALNLGAKKRSRMSSMYNSKMADLPNDSWMKSKSTECLLEEPFTKEKRASEMVKITSYSDWDLVQSYDNNIKDHNHVIDMYLKGNIINLITGLDTYEFDQSGLVKCGRDSTIYSPTKKTRNQDQLSLGDEFFKPRIVDVVFKESFIKYSLNRAEREEDVTQTKFWLLELEKTLNTKFHKEELYMQEAEILT